VNQGGGSYQDVCIADELALLVKVGIDVCSLNNHFISQWKDVALVAAFLKGGYLADRSFGSQPTEDLISSDNREGKTAITRQVLPGALLNLRVSTFHHLR